MAMILFGLILSSCSDSSTGPDPEPPAEEAVYAVYWRLNTPDGRTNYVSLVSDLMNGEVDPSNALEVAGQSRFFSQPGSEYFVAGNGETLTFTRYNITSENTIEEGGQFSLANEGVTSLLNRNVFLSDTKAYYIDNTQGQVIIWNPEEMSITGSFNLPEELADGYQGFTTQLGFNGYQQNGNRLSIPVGWVNFDANTHLDKTGLAILDTENDQVLSYTEDTRCAMATEPAFTDNGDVYFGVSERYHFSTAARATEDVGCILRKAAGADEFDQDYDPYMMDQIEGEKVGMSLFNSPKKDHAYFRVLDTDLMEWSADIEGIDYYNTVWNTYEINLPENEVTGKVDLPHGPSYSAPIYQVDGFLYSRLKLNDEGEHKVIRYSADGSYEEGITTPGLISDVVRLR